jgi:hypothetical protein
MESHARFDLTSAIARWTADLAARGNLDPARVAELESHLRDSVADLRQRGLDDAETFLIATRRLGSPSQIEAEFEKTESGVLPRRALWWLILGVAGWTALSAALGAMESVLAFCGSAFASDAMTFAAFLGGAKLLTFGLIAWVLLAVANRHPRIETLVDFIGRHPGRLVFFLLVANVLCHVTSWFSRVVLLRRVSVSLLGEFATVLSYSSIVSWVVSLALIAFVVMKVRPSRLAC